MNEKPKRKLGWRLLRWGLIGLAALITLAAMLITEENWRGKRAWENYKREWEAKGEKFNWQAFVPPTVPDDQNFFTAPVFTNLRNGRIGMSPYGDDGKPDVHSDASRSGYALYRMYLTDFQQWQNYYHHQTNTDMAKRFPVLPQIQTPAADVLFALGKFDSAVDELREASQRPYANVLLNYEAGFDALSPLLEDLAALKRCIQALQLRAVAELAVGQSAKALDDVKLLLRLNDCLHSSPFLISYLVRMAIVNIALQPVWEGLAEHKWSDEQLIKLEAELTKVDFLADYGFVMRGERAFAIASFENQRRTRKMIQNQDGDSGTNKPVVVSLRFMPSAYFYQNELAFAIVQQQWILPLVDTNARIVSPQALRRADADVRAEMKQLYFTPYKAQALMVVPALNAGVKKFAAIQASIDLALIACALERYRLAHGEYPDTLDMLAPQFIAQLPHDIINGEPLHYRRTEDGQFILYSVGWDEKDNDGKIFFTKAGSVDRENGDWVWQYPSK
ncbi:MAG: hypothetical protein WDN00_18450 [Limisphaerales bacterium]